jgi:hypothetical protein
MAKGHAEQCRNGRYNDEDGGDKPVANVSRDD